MGEQSAHLRAVLRLVTLCIMLVSLGRLLSSHSVKHSRELVDEDKEPLPATVLLVSKAPGERSTSNLPTIKQPNYRPQGNFGSDWQMKLELGSAQSFARSLDKCILSVRFQVSGTNRAQRVLQGTSSSILTFKSAAIKIGCLMHSHLSNLSNRAP